MNSFTQERSPFDGIGPRDFFAYGRWLTTMLQAVGKHEVIADFRADTNCQWQPGQTPIEQMVDDACGVGFEVMRQFAKWWTKKHWGVNPDGSAMDVDDFPEKWQPSAN